MTKMLTILRLLAIASFPAIQAVVDGARLGCFLWPNVTGGAYGTDVNYPNYPYGDGNCPAYCLSTGQYTYSIHAEQYRGSAGTDNWCSCSNTRPDTRLMLEECWEIGDLTPGNMTVEVLTSKWLDAVCYANPPATPANSATDIPQCFRNCKNNLYATMVFHQNQLKCRCYDTPTWTSHPRASCLEDSLFVFTNNRSTSSGGTTRHVKRAEIGERSPSLCPAGLTACKIVSDDPFTFECIDVDNELESCGGCAHGVYGQPNSHIISSGQNCLQLPGVRENRVACHQGKCEVYGCQDGFKLVKNRCVSMS